MTLEERTATQDTLDKFDKLQTEITNADRIIDTLDSRLDVIHDGNCICEDIVVSISVVGYTMREFHFNEEQITKLKEVLDSYRYDMRKRQEEL